MKKNLIVSLCAAAAVGMGMWAAILTSLDEDGAIDPGEARSETVSTDTETSWGLSFREEGAPPEGNAPADYLSRFGAYYIDEKGARDKTIYLTFDAGYENGNTEDILDVLKEKDVPAAFFVVGNFVEDEPEILRRMEAEGHIVGNHTMTHPDMASIADIDEFRGELTELEEAYKAVTGKEMKKFYRPPRGVYSENNLKQAQDMGYTTVLWSLAYEDWYENDQPAREEALNLLNKRIHSGAIVLLHSTSKTNARILGELIDGWREKGYKFESIDKLLT